MSDDDGLNQSHLSMIDSFYDFSPQLVELSDFTGVF